MDSLEMKVAMKRNKDTQEKLAEALGLQISGVNARINGKVDFRASEIETIKRRYHLTADEIDRIFFSRNAS
jgi:transcriptional regulator with XRE-family HTH domain